MPEYTLLCLCPKDHLMVAGYHLTRNTLTFTMISMKIVTTVVLIKKLKVVILTVFQSFVSKLLQLLSKLECCVILSALTNYKKSPRRRLGDHGGCPQGVQWKVCPCARQVWSPQQLLSSEIALLCLPSQTNRDITFSAQLPCLGSCCFGANFVQICCLFWSKSKSLLCKNKSAKWKLDFYPDLLWIVQLPWIFIFFFLNLGLLDS